MWATIASIPFFMVLVVELPFAPVRAFQYLGGLLIVRHILDHAVQAQASVRKSASSFSAILFIGVVCFSLFMPVLISETVFVVPEGSGSFLRAYENPQKLRFDISNITQVLYPLFGVVLFLVFAANLRSREDVMRVVRILIWGMVLLVGFSVVFIACYFLGLQSVMDLVFAWTTEVEPKFSEYNAFAGLIRPETLAGEPGYTGLYYILVFGILIGLVTGGYRGNWKPQHSGLLVVMFAVAIVMNGSTTAYFGGVALGASFLLAAFLRRSRSIVSTSSTRTAVKFIVAAGGVLVSLLVILQLAGISLVEYAVENHLAKMTEQEGSGAIRFLAFQYSLTEVFAKSPWFGVGYGSHRATSLLVVLLANVGIVGSTAFLTFNGAVFMRAVRAMNQASDSWLASFAFSFVVVHPAFLITLLIGKSETSFSFGWLWLLLGMMEACYRIHRQEIKQRSAPVASVS